MSYNRYKNTQKRKNYLLIHNKEKYDRVSIILPKGTKEKIKRLDILNRTLCQGHFQKKERSSSSCRNRCFLFFIKLSSMGKYPFLYTHNTRLGIALLTSIGICSCCNNPSTYLFLNAETQNLCTQIYGFHPSCARKSSPEVHYPNNYLFST